MSDFEISGQELDAIGGGEAGMPTSDLPMPVEEPTQGTVWERLVEVAKTTSTDFHESTQRARLVAAGLGTVALQTLDRARASVVLVPTVALNVFQHTQSPTEAAAAAGVAFGVWCAAVAGSTAASLHHFPRTVQKFESNFPGFVGVFEDALPGLERPDPEQPKPSAIRRVGNRALTGVKRGFMALGVGTVPYVSTAAAKGWSSNEIRNLNLNTSLDGALAVSAVVEGTGTAILMVGEHNPELAQTIENVSSNPLLWLGVSAVLGAGQFVSNRMHRNQA